MLTIFSGIQVVTETETEGGKCGLTNKMNVNGWMVGVDDNVENERRQKLKEKEDVSWSNIHITNELREGLLVEVFVQHPGKTSAGTTEQQEGRREERQR